MMRVFTSSEMVFLEEVAVQTGKTLEQLMLTAGTAVADFIKKETNIKGKRVVILCGKGNNGGDGFVCARKLNEAGAIVSVILAQSQIKTSLAKNAFAQLNGQINVVRNNMEAKNNSELIKNADVIVDAIFGIGFSGDIDGYPAWLIKYANKSKAKKIAVDIPSGCHCNTGKTSENTFKADYTLTFTAVKPANILQPSKEYCGKTIVVNIGIDKTLMNFLPHSISIINQKLVNSYFTPRNSDSHKGTYGRLLMICGSYGMIGAAIMAAKAALRSGIGLLNMVVTRQCYPIIAPMVPEAVFTIMDFSDEKTTKESSDELFKAINKATACVMGCGLGDDSYRYVDAVIKFAKCPILIDADGLNFIAEHMEILKLKKSEIIITPHLKEMSRLNGRLISQIQAEKMFCAKSFSKEHNIYTVLKGSGTIIATPDGEVYINTNGNAGMATGGSGDVLSGIIGGLLAQGMLAEHAANAGVYIHGYAADICANKYSQISMLPTDIVDALPYAFKKIETDLK